MYSAPAESRACTCQLAADHARESQTEGRGKGEDREERGVGGGKCKVEITSAKRQQDVSRVVTLVAGHMQGCLTSSHQVHFVHVWSPRASSPRAAHQCQESDIGGASQDFMESQGYEACQVAGAERGFSSDAAAKI